MRLFGFILVTVNAFMYPVTHSPWTALAVACGFLVVIEEGRRES